MSLPEFVRIKQQTILKAFTPDSSLLPGSFSTPVKQGTTFKVLGKVGNAYRVEGIVFGDHVVPLDRSLKESNLEIMAGEFNLEVAHLKAIFEVESRGSGFLQIGLPKILFEAHHFGRLTNYRYNNSHPDISSRSWNRSLYKGGDREWDRLNKAYTLDQEAALKSASWGLGQVMGFNYQTCGYDTVFDFVKDMFLSEAKQFRAVMLFLKGNNLLAALRSNQWETVARGYNGPAFKTNNYHNKLKSAYFKHKK